MDERVLFYFGMLCIGYILFAYECGKIKKKYNDLMEDHKRLKNDVKLLQQENFYLKKLLNQNADSVK